MKSFKFIFCNIVLCFVIFQPALGRLEKIDATPLKIESNESFRLIFTYGGNQKNIEWIVEKEDGNHTYYIAGASSFGNGNAQNLILNGPGWLRGGTYFGSVTLATVEILPTSEMQKYLPGGGGSSSSSSASGEQKNVTVIPENTPSNVQITLEQSTDLVNWSVVQPGSFAPSTTKRFFRIRSEQE